jgi:hypothetical protein
MENRPINRIGKFFSEEDMSLHLDLGYEYLHGDVNMTILLYQVDTLRTDTDDIYAEATTNQIVFLPPVEINCLVTVEEAKNNTYKDGAVRYLEPGNLTFRVYIRHLDELGVDIKHGDYIGYKENDSVIRFYNVSNDGKVVTDNKHMHFGFKPYFRTITCVPTQENEFNGV